MDSHTTTNCLPSLGAVPHLSGVPCAYAAPAAAGCLTGEEKAWCCCGSGWVALPEGRSRSMPAAAAAAAAGAAAGLVQGGWFASYSAAGRGPQPVATALGLVSALLGGGGYGRRLSRTCMVRGCEFRCGEAGQAARVRQLVRSAAEERRLWWAAALALLRRPIRLAGETPSVVQGRSDAPEGPAARRRATWLPMCSAGRPNFLGAAASLTCVAAEGGGADTAAWQGSRERNCRWMGWLEATQRSTAIQRFNNQRQDASGRLRELRSPHNRPQGSWDHAPLPPPLPLPPAQHSGRAAWHHL